MKQPFAVFDIDGTIFRSSLFLETIYRSVEKGILPKSVKTDITSHREAWLKRQSSDAYDVYIMKAVDSFERNFIGVEASEMQKIAKEVVDDYHEHTYVYTRDLLKKLKTAGYFIIAISGSLEEVVSEFTKHYDFDYVRPTYLHKKDGKYTGTYNIADSNKKAELQKIIDKFDLSLSGSYAVGDSGNDISMLELVKNPIAFNPDKKLFEAAKKRHWKVVVERKNMIYELECVNGQYILA